MAAENCPSRQVLLAYETGELSEPTAEGVIAHISTCPDCQAGLATLGEANDTLVAQLRRPPAADPYAAEPECREAVIRMKEQAGGAFRVRTLPDAELTEPTVLRELGEYQLLEKLGEGGMGVVYRARHTKLKRLVALKILPTRSMQYQRAIARFEREMEAVGRVNHPNIVQAYDAREIEGTWFLVMEYVDGVDLGELVRWHGPLPIPDACELIRQAATGLQYAHEHGLIHRDIKPSNLILSRGGQLKILDLGLALLKGDQPTGEELTDGHGALGRLAEDLTAAQQVMGTASYMAPEQGSDSHQVDVRADIYSLGCTLYKLLAGRPPFGGAEYRTPPDQMMAHRTKPVEPIGKLRPEVLPELGAVVQRMLAKNPADRFATPAEVARAVVGFTTGCDLPRLALRAEASVRLGGRAAEDPCAGSGAGLESIVKRAVEGLEGEHEASSPKPRTARRRWRIVVALACLLLSLGGIVYWGVIVRVRQPDGQEAELNVPDGSRVDIDSRGQVQVTLPAPAGPAIAGEDRTKKRGGPAAVIRARPGTGLLHEERFSEPGPGLPQHWQTARGAWKVEGGSLAVRMEQPYYCAFAFGPSASWRDYAVECDMRLDQGVAGITFRRDGQGRFYTFQVRLPESNAGYQQLPAVEFRKYSLQPESPASRGQKVSAPVYGGPTIARKEYVLLREKYHRLRVEAAGNSMRAFIDGQFVLDAEDQDSPMRAGSVGLIAADACFKPGIAFFRNLRVESLGPRAQAAWEFDEGQGTIVRDSSGSGNHGTLHGGFQWVEGREGKALLLNGKDGFVRIPDSPSQSGMKQLSLRAVFKLHAFPKGSVALVRKWGPLFDARGPEDDSFSLHVGADGSLQFQAQNGVDLGDCAVASKPVPLDRWVEVIAVYDGVRNSLYVRAEDGPWAAYHGFTMPGRFQHFAIRDTDEPMEIGTEPQHEVFLQATIDSIRMSAEVEIPETSRNADPRSD